MEYLSRQWVDTKGNLEGFRKVWVASGPLVKGISLFGLLASMIVVYEKLFRSPLFFIVGRLRNRCTALWSVTDPATTDPPVIKKHSTFQSFTTPYATYPSIRTFYHPHPQEKKLPDDARPLPLLVFVHGLGGSMAQFAPVLGSLVNVAPCLGIDFPGCGLSSFAPRKWEAYSIEAITALVDAVITEYRAESQGVVLIAHSMGCSVSAMLISRQSNHMTAVRGHVLGFVALCPLAVPPSEKQVSFYRKFLHAPNTVFDLYRWWDRRGGLESNSIKRNTGSKAGVDTRKLQERFNEQSRTPVWRRMAWGTLPEYGRDGSRKGGVPGKEIWSGVDVPLFLVAGEADALTKPENVARIMQYLRRPSLPEGSAEEIDGDAVLPNASTVHDRRSDASLAHEIADERKFGVDPLTHHSSFTRAQIIKTTILPSPASHALMYDHATYRTLAGLIVDFLSTHVSYTLSLGWQLQQLTTSGKWDVKNLAKWKGVVPVSAPIGPDGMFRALKTLREQDEEHTPVKFVNTWKGEIYALIDISHDSPIYNPAELEKGGIQYHKFPTVSKIPPTVDEVQDFIALVERLRAEISSSSDMKSEPSGALPAIGVHCHYGYNRTGFFIVSYLIEKKGYRVQDAIDEFEQQRPPGIRHDHFLDTLFVRFCVGLKKAPTIAEGS